MYNRKKERTSRLTHLSTSLTDSTFCSSAVTSSTSMAYSSGDGHAFLLLKVFGFGVSEEVISSFFVTNADDRCVVRRRRKKKKNRDAYIA